MTSPVVVTRHKALVDYLVEQGLVEEGVEVLEHVSASDVEGRNVIGVLPLSLAAHALTVTEIPLSLTREMRGKELTLDEVRSVACDPVTYTVTCIGGPK